MSVSLKKLIFFVLIISHTDSALTAQSFNRQDTLRGSVTPERAWWDLLHYELKVKVDPSKKHISGSNTIRYKVLESSKRIQIDLQDPLMITKVSQDGQKLGFKKDGFAYFIDLEKNQNIGDINELIIEYEGLPVESINPPWSGGFTWKKDGNGKDFIATSCQGIGASIWWPNKDHMYDEPDLGMRIHAACPEDLIAVANGRLVYTIKNPDKTRTFVWEVKNPINNYGVNINIGDYVSFDEKYTGLKGALDCTYYVLRDNLTQAKEQFKQVPLMLKAFEHWFGPYPFYEDSFKLVEVPYLGMEHQNSITYGNQYKNGYLGRDLSRSGWGLKFDFIIIHESGHEWFANNITYKDVADMWIHEGFAAYSETLYTDYHFGKEAGNDYIVGTRNNIKNDRPIIGIYNVNNEGSGDMYPKAANMLHTIRQLIDNDEKFRQILIGLNKTFYHQTVTTKEIENYISINSKMDLAKVFDQYLRTTMIPVFEYKIEAGELQYRYNNVVDGFDMPIKVSLGKKTQWIKPNQQWQKMNIASSVDTDFTIDRNFYVIHSKQP